MDLNQCNTDNGFLYRHIPQYHFLPSIWNCDLLVLHHNHTIETQLLNCSHQMQLLLHDIHVTQIAFYDCFCFEKKRVRLSSAKYPWWKVGYKNTVKVRVTSHEVDECWRENRLSNYSTGLIKPSLMLLRIYRVQIYLQPPSFIIGVKRNISFIVWTNDSLGPYTIKSAYQDRFRELNPGRIKVPGCEKGQKE